MSTIPSTPFVANTLVADLNEQIKAELQGAEEVTPQLISMLRQKFGILPPQSITTWIKA